MSSVSEQDHLNPRDPLYYAPRWLRERSALRDAGAETPFSPASFDSQLESAVSDALRHPLDPEIMREPDLEKKALWTVAARFAAAIGVAAVVALFFVVAVPGSRQSDSEPSTFSGIAQSIKNALSQSGEASQKPAINEFQALLASTPPSAPAASEQPGQLLQQFMQWREKPDPATPQRTNP
jgi:cell pole-organizing protein PopZ